MRRVAGPTLAGQGRHALRFAGLTRLVTPVSPVVVTASPRWTIELWFLSLGCGTTFERLIADSLDTAEGRAGLDVLHYPKISKAPCRVGAEIWLRGRFQGGCSGPDVPAVGAWHHYAVRREGARLTCYLDGRAVNESSVRTTESVAHRRIGLGGSGTGYDHALVGDLADVAVYARALAPEVLLRHARALEAQ